MHEPRDDAPPWGAPPAARNEFAATTGDDGFGIAEIALGDRRASRVPTGTGGDACQVCFRGKACSWPPSFAP